MGQGKEFMASRTSNREFSSHAGSSVIFSDQFHLHQMEWKMKESQLSVFVVICLVSTSLSMDENLLQPLAFRYQKLQSQDVWKFPDWG